MSLVGSTQGSPVSTFGYVNGVFQSSSRTTVCHAAAKTVVDRVPRIQVVLGEQEVPAVLACGRGGQERRGTRRVRVVHVGDGEHLVGGGVRQRRQLAELPEQSGGAEPGLRRTDARRAS